MLLLSKILKLNVNHPASNLSFKFHADSRRLINAENIDFVMELVSQIPNNYPLKSVKGNIHHLDSLNII